MRFARIGHNREYYARRDDDYLYEGKVEASDMYAMPGIDVESMVSLTEMNCVTSNRTRRHPLLHSLLSFTLLRHASYFRRSHYRFAMRKCAILHGTSD